MFSYSVTNLLGNHMEEVFSTMVYAITDKNASIISCSDKFLKLYGFEDKEEVIGVGFKAIHSSETSPIIYKSMWHHINLRQPWSGVVINKHSKTNELIYVHLQIIPLITEDELVGFLAIQQDRTRLITIENDIRDINTKLNTYLDYVPTPIFCFDTENNLTYNNSQIYNYVSETTFVERWLSTGNLTFLCDDDSDEILDIDNQSLFNSDCFKIKYTDTKNNTHWFKAQMDDLGKFGKMVTLVDMTKAEISINNALKSEQKNRMIASYVSHEIRTPLNATLGFTDLILKQHIPDITRSYVNVIKENSELSLEFINDVLDLAKTNSPKNTMLKDKVDLKKELYSLVDTFALLSLKKNIHFYINLDNSIPSTIQIDITKLKQVVVNLLSNAIKFTDTGAVGVEVTSMIDMSLSDFHGYEMRTLEIKVLDTGIGMTASEQEQVFMPYVQANDQISKKYGGTGLGMSLCKRYTELMGGTISIESEKGVGTVYTIHVPITIIEDRDWSPTAEEIDIPMAKNLRCYLMDFSMGDSDEQKALTSHLKHIYDEKFIRLGLVPVWITTDILNRGNWDSLDKAIYFVATDMIPTISDEDEMHDENVLEMFPPNTIFVKNNLNDNTDKLLDNNIMISIPLTTTKIRNAVTTLLNGDKITHDEPKLKAPENYKFNASVLFVEDNKSNQIFIKTVTNGRFSKIDIVGTAKDMKQKIMDNHYDIIFTDEHLPDGLGTQTIRELETENPEIISSSAIVLISGMQKEEIEELRYFSSTISDFLLKPFKAEDIFEIAKKYVTYETIEETGVEVLDNKELKTNFVNYNREYMDSLEKAIATANFKGINVSAHSIKGAASMSGLVELSSLARKLEVLGKEEIIEGCKPIFKKLLNIFNNL